VAELAEADALLASGKTSAAVALYMKIATRNKNGLGDVARIRAAWAQADTMTTPELHALLAPLNDGKSAWRFMAQEILAYRDFHDGRTDQAGKAFQTLADAKEAPSSIRLRAQAMATLIRTSGGKNYGTVPMPSEAAQSGKQDKP
jgi:hypothetical protein